MNSTCGPGLSPDAKEEHCVLWVAPAAPLEWYLNESWPTSTFDCLVGTNPGYLVAPIFPEQPILSRCSQQSVFLPLFLLTSLGSRNLLRVVGPPSPPSVLLSSVPVWFGPYWSCWGGVGLWSWKTCEPLPMPPLPFGWQVLPASLSCGQVLFTSLPFPVCPPADTLRAPRSCLCFVPKLGSLTGHKPLSLSFGQVGWHVFCFFSLDKLSIFYRYLMISELWLSQVKTPSFR